MSDIHIHNSTVTINVYSRLSKVVEELTDEEIDVIGFELVQEIRQLLDEKREVMK